LGDSWKEGEVILSNHPLAGGTHLPDMTIITPVFRNGSPVFFVASRGHHSDIGGIQPGSMPSFSKFLEEEGAAFMSFKIIENGKFQQEKLTDILMN
jgi:5-oxoprolinase (ATP-hydrolysing)